MSEESKQNIKEYGKQCRKSMSEEEKQKMKEYLKEYKKRSIQQCIEEHRRK